MRSKSQNRMGRHGSEVQAVGPSREQSSEHSTSTVTSSHARLEPQGCLECCRTELALILPLRHDPHPPTSSLAWDCWKVSLEAPIGWFTRGPSNEPGQQVPGKVPGRMHNYFTRSRRLQVSRMCLLVSLPVLWGRVD